MKLLLSLAELARVEVLYVAVLLSWWLSDDSLCVLHSPLCFPALDTMY